MSIFLNLKGNNVNFSGNKIHIGFSIKTNPQKKTSNTFF